MKINKWKGNFDIMILLFVNLLKYFVNFRYLKRNSNISLENDNKTVQNEKPGTSKKTRYIIATN